MTKRCGLLVCGLIAALTLAGCWSPYGPQGQSNTCSSNAYNLSGFRWDEGFYRPLVAGVNYRVRMDGINPEEAKGSLQYGPDALGHSYNTCGIPDDDVFTAIPIGGSEIGMTVSEYERGFPSYDGVSRADFGYLDHICAGCAGAAWYSETVWSGLWYSLVDADIRLNYELVWSGPAIRAAALHEAGHAAGLCHNGGCIGNGGYLADGNVMGNAGGQQLGRGDLSGLHSIYGGHTH